MVSTACRLPADGWFKRMPRVPIAAVFGFREKPGTLFALALDSTVAKFG